MNSRPRVPPARALLLAAAILGLTGWTMGQRAAPVAAGATRVTSAGTGGINHPSQRDKAHVILISLDGFRPDYLDRYDLPNVRRVLRRGTRARSMTPVFPSLTFPNHYSLVTGLHPEQHGIVGNTFYDPERRASYSFRDPQTVADGSWYRGEPIWVTAERQGMVAACFFFPGSEAAIQGVRPTFWNKYDGSIPNRTRVDTVLGWLRMPRERRPHVITLYFSDVDSVSHQGPLEAPAVKAAAEALDDSIGRLIDGIDTLPIRDRIYLLLTSDHGMVETSASQTIMLKSLIDGIDGVQVGFSGPVASLHVTGGREHAARVREHINGRLKRGRAYLRDEVPERHRYRADPRIGDVVVIMEESWTLATSVLSRLRLLQPWGQHGWDPALPSMQAIFVISGPDIRADATIPEIHNVDVYPLMTELLGLRPADGVAGRSGYLRRLVRAVQ